MATKAAKKDFIVGSYIIDSDQIYTISKIESDRLFYHPARIENAHQTVTGSIPKDNAIISGFRPLLSSEHVEKFYSDLTTATPTEIPLDSKTFKDITCQNDPFTVIPIIKQLWYNKNQPNVNFSNSSRDTLETLLNHICYEFSLVTKKPSDAIREKIIKILSK